MRFVCLLDLQNHATFEMNILFNIKREAAELPRLCDVLARSVSVYYMEFFSPVKYWMAPAVGQFGSQGCKRASQQHELAELPLTALLSRALGSHFSSGGQQCTF